MRFILFLLCTAFAMVSGDTKEEREEMVIGLATLFEITTSETELCIQETGVRTNDLILLNDVMTYKKISGIDKTSLRRASCTIACLAKAQGTMSDAKIQVPKALQNLQQSELPAHYKRAFRLLLNECSKQVKTITDECDVVLEFIKCLYDQIQDVTP